MGNPQQIREASRISARKIFQEVQRAGASPLSIKQFSEIIEHDLKTVVAKDESSVNLSRKRKRVP